MWNRSVGMLVKGLSNRLVVLIALGALLPTAFASLCAAQDSRMQGYIFVAPGLRTHEEAATGIIHFGGGGEALIGKGLSAAAEIGYLVPFQETSEHLGLLSLDAYYHKPRGNKVVLFVFAGYSVGISDNTFETGRSQTTSLLNFGGGATCWLTRGKGLRFEVRDHLYTAETDRHYLEFRFGFAFR